MNRIAVFGTHERQTLSQLEDVASRAERAALMATRSTIGLRDLPRRIVSHDL